MLKEDYLNQNEFFRELMPNADGNVNSDSADNESAYGIGLINNEDLTDNVFSVIDELFENISDKGSGWNHCYDIIFSCLYRTFPILIVFIINYVFDTKFPKNVHVAKYDSRFNKNKVQEIISDCFAIIKHDEKYYAFIIEMQCIKDKTMEDRLNDYVSEAERSLKSEHKEYEYIKGMCIQLRCNHNTETHYGKHPVLRLSDLNLQTCIENRLYILIPYLIFSEKVDSDFNIELFFSEVLSAIDNLTFEKNDILKIDGEMLSMYLKCAFVAITAKYFAKDKDTLEDIKRMIPYELAKQVDEFFEVWKNKDKAYDEAKAEGKSEGLTEGIAIGKSEGIAIGKAEGKSECRAEMIYTLVNNKINNDNITEKEACKIIGVKISDYKKAKTFMESL